MDPITRLEDSLDTLLKVMASAIAYLSRKAGHKQVNPRVPLTVLGTTEALPEDELRANRDELVHDLVAQAKEVEQHIAALPVLDTDESARTARLEALQGQLRTANDEYRAALQEAHTLLAQLDGLLARLCAQRQDARAVLDPPPSQSRGSDERNS
ncbi:hypothetical protein MOBT1_000301 [Malassezia obtusa]|uniref:Mediator of RNA polymerase II transcription subunit 21 n=1 Tax=Malassezia obtusa TaxID=76774 RepID=A0AAF0IQJ1_9BASI|nr:hypothetical protein MOBT1_000301 [Malassezia obtusa]